MPSTALGEFKANLTDVNRLVALHRRESGAGRGRRGLGHITRGGLVLLCAAWERYVETAISEGANFLTTKLPNAAALPANVHQKITSHANHKSTPWTVADVATPLWNVIYLDAISKRVSTLHTPKHYNLKPMYHDFLGVADIGTSWAAGVTAIDDFVGVRGDVAHQGGQSKYVKISTLVDAQARITSTVTEMDNFLSDHIRVMVTPNRRPWNRAA